MNKDKKIVVHTHRLLALSTQAPERRNFSKHHQISFTQTRFGPQVFGGFL